MICAYCNACPCGCGATPGTATGRLRSSGWVEFGVGMDRLQAKAEANKREAEAMLEGLKMGLFMASPLLVVALIAWAVSP